MCVNGRTQKMWPSQQTRSNILAGELKSSEASCLHNCFSFMFGEHNFFFVLDTVFGSVLTSPGVLFYFSHSPTEHQANPYLALITLMQAYGCSWLLNGGSKESPSQQRH